MSKWCHYCGYDNPPYDDETTCYQCRCENATVEAPQFVSAPAPRAEVKVRTDLLRVFQTEAVEPMPEPPILRYFAYEHLPPAMQVHSKPFHDLARIMFGLCKPSEELTEALRKLLEAKDCYVRANLP